MAAQASSSALGHASWSPVVTAVDWFEIRDLGAGMHLIAEPGHVNSFLVTGGHTALLFDTGMGIGRISAAVETLTDLPLLVVNSHDHLDHRGGNADLLQRREEQDVVDIAAHPLAVNAGHRAVPAGFLRHYEDAMRDVYADYLAYLALDVQSFFVAAPLPRMRPIPDLSGWQVPAVRPTRALLDGEQIDLGGRTLTVLHTPGHTVDGICLVEHETRTLLAGDTLLAAAHWLHGDGSDLAAFTTTTARLAGMPIERVLTAHHLVAEKPGSHAADVARAARMVLSGESIPRPGTDLLGRPAGRHDIDGVVILTAPAPGGESE